MRIVRAGIGRVDIGRLTDNEARAFAFDVTEMLECMDDGYNISCYATAPNSNDAYLIPPTNYYIEGTDLIWIITDVETAQTGTGKFAITLYNDHGQVVNSQIYKTRVDKSLIGDADPPDAWDEYLLTIEALRDETLDIAEDLVDDVTAIKEQAEDARDDAQDYADRIENMTASASVDANVGVPTVTITKTENPLNLDFAFSNLRGADGIGMTGGTGASSIIIEMDNTIAALPDEQNYASGTQALAIGTWSGMKYANLKFSADAGSTTMTYECNNVANIGFMEQFERLATAFVPNIYLADDWTPTKTAQITAIDTSTKTLTLASAYSDEAVSGFAFVIYTPSVASGYKSRAIGAGSIASGYEAVAVGASCIASNNYAFAAGQHTTASGVASFAEGGVNLASGQDSHAEGFGNKASGKMSHAEGSANTTSGNYSHAEGSENISSGDYSHTEGYHNTASAGKAHAEGQGTTASGAMSHAEGDRTIANHRSQHVFGQFNVADPSSAGVTVIGNYIEIVGNGTADNARSNARTLDWSGNEVLAGKLTVGSAPTNDMDVATKKYVDDRTETVETVTGTSVTIDGVNNHRYICGELTALTITAPASGIIDIIFESGATPTTLTATDITLPDDFAVEANTRYEINILDGYAVVASWT